MIKNILKNNKNIRTKKRGAEKGFTLVEMLVSVAIFSVFMLVAVSVVLSIIGGNRKAQQINAVVNNLNFSIESMVRDMKTGFFYKCPTDAYDLTNSGFFEYPTADSACSPSDPQTTVAFVSVLNDGIPSAVEYSFVPAPIDGVGKIVKRYVPPGGSSIIEVDLTPPEVNVKSVKFYLNSQKPGGLTQPSVFMLIAGTAKLGAKESDFMLQTLVSQRILNVGVE